MKIEAPRVPLLNCLKLAATATAKKTSKDVYRDVKVTARDGFIAVCATDLESGITQQLGGVDVRASGVSIWPIDRLAEILRELPDDTVSIEADEALFVLRGAEGEFRIETCNPADFADLGSIPDESKFFEVTAGDLSRAIQRTIWAVGRNPAKLGKFSSAMGILFDATPKSLTLVGTDTKVMAVAEIPKIPGGNHDTEIRGAIVPPSVLRLVASALYGLRPDYPVGLYLLENTIVFDCGETLIWSRLIEGRFPNRAAVAKKPKFTVSLPVGATLATFRQSAVLRDRELCCVEIKLEPGKLTANTVGRGSSRVTQPLELHGFQPIVLRLDPEYLIDLLREMDPQGVVDLGIVDSKTNLTFAAQDGYVCYLVPMVFVESGELK